MGLRSRARLRQDRPRDRPILVALAYVAGRSHLSSNDHGWCDRIDDGALTPNSAISTRHPPPQAVELSAQGSPLPTLPGGLADQTVLRTS